MSTFKKSFSGLASASVLAVVMSLSAQYALAGIDGSKHDLGTSDFVGTDPISGLPANTTSQICVFCHTPHGSDTTVDAPLWNKGLTDATAFDTYTSATLDSDTGTVSGVSLACLSCHDGTQARDNFINAPGSGGYDVAGASYGGMTDMATQFPDAVTVLGTDLRNDHPISMNYAAASSLASMVAGVFGDADFKAVTRVTNASGTRVWIDTGTTGAGTFQKSDLPLYGTDVGTDRIQVQCATCHDPHNTANGTFLRIANTGSAVCLACHNK